MRSVDDKDKKVKEFLSLKNKIFQEQLFIILDMNEKKERRNMKIQFWSKEKTGKWASILTLLFIVLMIIKLLFLAISIRLPLPSLFIVTLGVIGFILGIISIFKNKDRSLFVLLSMPVGLLIIFWVAAEIIFPH